MDVKEQLDVSLSPSILDPGVRVSNINNMFCVYSMGVYCDNFLRY